MSRLTVRASATAQVRGSIEDVWSHMDTMAKVAALTESVKECTALGESGAWQWDLGRHGALGVHVHLVLELSGQFDHPNQVTVRPTGDAASWARGQGIIRLASVNDQVTTASAMVDLDVQVTVPRLLTGPLGRVVEHEVRQALEQLLRALRVAAESQG